MKTVGERLIEGLAARGVEVVFGIDRKSVV